MCVCVCVSEEPGGEGTKTRCSQLSRRTWHGALTEEQEQRGQSAHTRTQHQSPSNTRLDTYRERERESTGFPSAPVFASFVDGSVARLTLVIRTMLLHFVVPLATICC